MLCLHTHRGDGGRKCELIIAAPASSPKFGLTTAPQNSDLARLGRGLGQGSSGKLSRYVAYKHARNSHQLLRKIGSCLGTWHKLW